MLEYACDQFRRCRGFTEVRGKCCRRAARRAAQRRRFVRFRGGLAVMHRHAAARAGESHGDSASDAVRGAGDEGDRAG